jgi:hypothetical protein
VFRFAPNRSAYAERILRALAVVTAAALVLVGAADARAPVRSLGA